MYRFIDYLIHVRFRKFVDNSTSTELWSIKPLIATINSKRNCVSHKLYNKYFGSFSLDNYSNNKNMEIRQARAISRSMTKT